MEIDTRINDSFSLKDKRRIVKSLTEKVKNRFNVSIAEVGNNDILNFASFGIAVVSKNDSGFIDSVFDKIINFVEKNFEVEIVDVRRGLI